MTVVMLHHLKFKDTGTESLVVVTIDWRNAQHLEKKLQGRSWAGKPTYVMRDRQIKIVHGEGYMEKLLVGSRGRGGRMPMGVILRNAVYNELVMLQCAHGFKRIGKNPNSERLVSGKLPYLLSYRRRRILASPGFNPLGTG